MGAFTPVRSEWVLHADWVPSRRRFLAFSGSERKKKTRGKKAESGRKLRGKKKKKKLRKEKGKRKKKERENMVV
jgi:hypothetical protein